MSATPIRENLDLIKPILGTSLDLTVEYLHRRLRAGGARQAELEAANVIERLVEIIAIQAGTLK